MAQPTERIRGRAWQRIRREVLDVEPLCRTCLASGRVTVAAEIDHITPLHMGGHATDLDNLQPLCQPCHEAKTTTEAGDRAFSMTPDWLWPKGKLTVVCGPPGAGKTTYVSQHAKPGDVVVDLDDIIADLFGVHGHDVNDMAKVGAAIRERNRRLALLGNGDTVWLIASAPSMTERAYWKARGAAVVLLNPGHTICIKRASGRSRDYKQAVLRWYAEYGTVKRIGAVKRTIGLDGWAVQ